MNVLITYRLQAFKTEVYVQLDKYRNDNITFVVQNDYGFKWLPVFLERFSLKDINVKIITVEQFLKGELDSMTFDYIVGNPPYQEITGETTKPIWDKLVVKFYSLLKQKSKMSLIHPGAWRFATNKSKSAIKEVRKIYDENNVDMELNDILKGSETFGAATDYDIIYLTKEPRNRKSKIKMQNKIIECNIAKYGVLPTFNFETYLKLIPKNNEEQMILINDYNYGTDDRFKHTSSKKTDEFKYPVVDRFPDKKGIVLIYSNTKKFGHFAIPKLIVPRASFKSILDLEGEYGMTQFSSAIVDTPENLVKIQKVIESDIFKKLKHDFCGIGGSNINAIIDAPGTMFKFIKEFRKDFWKEFYTPEMEQELIKEGKLNKKGNYVE